MKTHVRSAVTAFALVSVMTWLPSEAAYAQGNTSSNFVAPAVFQAAGPTAASIQGTVDAYRAALGAPNNGNTAGPLASGRREINWDGGGGVDATTATRHAVQRVPEHPRRPVHHAGHGPFAGSTIGRPQGGLAGLFGNPTYGTIFSTFSPLRLFTPVGSNVTEALFFIPGTDGATRQRSAASARSSPTSTGRMGAVLARRKGTVAPAR